MPQLVETSDRRLGLADASTYSISHKVAKLCLTFVAQNKYKTGIMTKRR